MSKLKEVLTIIDTRLTSIEHTVNDVIIKSLLDADDEFIDNECFEKFSGAYDFDSIEPGLKILYGDDFDVKREFYNKIKSMDGYGTDGFDEVSSVNAKIQDFKDRLQKLGYNVEVKVENTDTEDGSLEAQLAEEFKAYSNGL